MKAETEIGRAGQYGYFAAVDVFRERRITEVGWYFQMRKRWIWVGDVSGKAEVEDGKGDTGGRTNAPA